MTGLGYGLFGAGFNFLFVTLVAIVLFVYVWLSSHGVRHMRHFHQVHIDAMAGDEGED